jgi:pyruvate/2-oxoglutarate/acetoin dehydrogenase E1 component
MAEADEPETAGTTSEREMTMSRAMVSAIASEMRDSDDVFVMGEDVADYGGIFGYTFIVRS